MRVNTRYVNSTRGTSPNEDVLLVDLRIYLWWSLCTLEDVPLVKFMYLAFTRMPGESYRRRLGSLLLYLCYVFRALINSLVCWFCTSALGLVLFQIGVRLGQALVVHCLVGSPADHKFVMMKMMMIAFI